MLSLEAYQRRVTGKGQAYKERIQEVVKCTLCDKELQKRRFRYHMRFSHNQTVMVKITIEVDHQEFHWTHGSPCPVYDCPFDPVGSRSYSTRRHVVFRHTDSELTIY